MSYIDISSTGGKYVLREKYDKLKAEVERLRKDGCEEIARLHEEVDVAEQNHRKTIAEVERLRKAFQDLAVGSICGCGTGSMNYAKLILGRE
jgi:hypothetical protein